MGKSSGGAGRSREGGSNVGSSIVSKEINDNYRALLGKEGVTKVNNATQKTYEQLKNGVATGKITQAQVKEFAYNGLRYNLKQGTGDLNGYLHQNMVTRMAWDIVNATYKR